MSSEKCTGVKKSQDRLHSIWFSEQIRTSTVGNALGERAKIRIN